MPSHTPESVAAPVGEIMKTWEEPRSSDRLAAFVLERLKRNDADLGI